MDALPKQLKLNSPVFGEGFRQYVSQAPEYIFVRKNPNVSRMELSCPLSSRRFCVMSIAATSSTYAVGLSAHLHQ